MRPMEHARVPGVEGGARHMWGTSSPFGAPRMLHVGLGSPHLPAPRALGKLSVMLGDGALFSPAVSRSDSIFSQSRLQLGPVMKK